MKILDRLYLIRNKLLFLIGIRGLRKYEFTEGDYEHRPHDVGLLGEEKTVLFPDKNCKPFRSEGELQNKGTETMACVTFSNLKAHATILNRMVDMVNKGEATEEIKEIVKIFRHFGIILGTKANVSERYIAKLSGTSWSGNNFKRVAQAVRDNGLIPESDYPYVQGWSSYYQNVPQDLINKGKKLLDYIEFNYEQVRQLHYGDAKRYSPVQTSVAPYGKSVNGIIPASWKRKVHAVENDNDGDFYGLFDSYEPFDKRVAKNYPLNSGLVFSMKLKKPLNVFNQVEIDKLRVDRGWEFVVLVENYKNYDKGIYELTEDGLEEVPMKTAVKEWVMKEKAEGDIEGINAENFAKLIT